MYASLIGHAPQPPFTPPPIELAGGRTKIQKSICWEGGQKYLFWWARGGYIVGREGRSRNFEVKIKTA